MTEDRASGWIGEYGRTHPPGDEIALAKDRRCIGYGAISVDTGIYLHGCRDMVNSVQG